MNGCADRGFGPESAVTEVLISDLRGVESVRTGGVDLAHVRMLAELEADLPPILVHSATMRIIDGLHRVRAAQSRGESTVSARFFDGTGGEAFIQAVRVNVIHGLPLSLADRKNAAARILLENPEWSDRAVADVVGLSDKTVGAVRRSNAEIPQPTERMGRNGAISRTSIVTGRLRAAELIRANPLMPLREVAATAGISLTTVKDVRSRLRHGVDPLPERHRGSTAPAVEPEPLPPTGGPLEELALQRLRRDPAVRSTEGGRWLLRWLEVTADDDRAHALAVASLPPYHLEAVAQLLRQRSAGWLRIAYQFDERARASLDEEVS